MNIYRACFETSIGEYSHCDYLLVAAEDFDSATKHFIQELTGWWGEETLIDGKESWNSFYNMVTHISWIKELAFEFVPSINGKTYEIEYSIIGEENENV